MGWKLLSPEEGKDWDRLLGAAGDDNPFQSEAWGRYKGRFGWEPQRWVASVNGGRTVCSVQLLKKTLPFGPAVIWAPGGPLIGFPGAAQEDLRSILSEGIREMGRANRAAYIRFYSLQPSSPKGLQSVSDVCRIPRRRLGSGVTVQMDLSPSWEQTLSRMDKKHRYLARRLGKDVVRWEWGASGALAADFSRLHGEMSAAKRVLAIDEKDLALLLYEFRENARILLGYAEDRPVTGCLVLLGRKGAFYWRAATAPRGRELSASYAMILKLLEMLKLEGFKRFDFGGILPGIASAAGINHFKQGFGGEVVEYLGEWEWANAPWIRWGVNAWVASRRRW